MAVRRIAVTGGPGAGKTTVWRAMAELHAERVVAVPEVATLMFAHVFPPVQNPAERYAVQRAIFEVQRNLETVYESRLGADQVLLCDRGVPDGAGYWPDGPEAFFEAMQTEWQAEIARYDVVLFLESAAVGGLSIAEGNPIRREDQAAAMHVDRCLRSVWAQHPNFQHVAHEHDFAVKVARGAQLLAAWL
jgi:predicted ATPase